MSTNWHSNPGGARTNNWNPTPPASPNNWSNAGGTTGWSSSNQGSGWAQPSEDALWSAAPGISTGPVRRGRSNSDSWGSAPPKGDSWEAVPGWSARPENNTGWSGATQPVYAQSGTQGTSWNNSARSNDSWSNAGAPGGGPNNNSTNSRWAPAGWDPLPPPKFGPGVGSVTGISPAPTVLSNWDAKRPSVDRTPAPKVAASTPAAPAPTVPAPAAPATPVGEKAVSFEVSEETVDKDPRGRDSSRPGRGRGAAAGGTYYTRDNRNATQNSALRKTKSAGGLDRKYRPDGKRGGGVNGDSMARGDSLNRGQAGGQQMQKINKRKTGK
ncbi:hypothetical protein BJ742DRAFT_394990 [Cladochytrium replicatum]|nr:hypothetical protein BJ742DRAFT_394990 [Cladochytrium replicatum]